MSGGESKEGFNAVLRERSNDLDNVFPDDKDLYPLPSSWTHMDSDDQVYEIVKLHTEDPYYKLIANLFYQPHKTWKYTIRKIERVQNPTLYRQFLVQKKDMQEHTDGNIEHKLWHGTSKVATDAINRYGFYRSYSGTSVGAIHGNGCYFAVESSTSAQDRYSQPDGSGLKRMYLARVLTGVYTKGKRGVKVPPEQPGKPNVQYDSLVDNVSNPKMSVVFNDCRAYPEYLVSFK